MNLLGILSTDIVCFKSVYSLASHPS